MVRPILWYNDLLAMAIYCADCGEFFDRKTLQPMSSRSGHGYVAVRINGLSYRRGRLAYFYAHGHWPEPTIDHINGNRADDRLINLRAASYKQQLHNRKKQLSNKTGHTGVQGMSAGTYAARILYDGRPISLGTYATAPEAAIAYTAAKKVMEFMLARIHNDAYPTSNMHIEEMQ
jgi:hypothetical protein